MKNEESILWIRKNLKLFIGKEFLKMIRNSIKYEDLIRPHVCLSLQSLLPGTINDKYSFVLI